MGKWGNGEKEYKDEDLFPLAFSPLRLFPFCPSSRCCP
jgi:hypothetical protein